MYIPFRGLPSEANVTESAQVHLENGRWLPCSMFELNAYECLEAYGLKTGMNLCVKFFEDLEECRTGQISIWRQRIMDLESTKKIFKGQMKLKDKYMNDTPWDAYIGGTFYP